MWNQKPYARWPEWKRQALKNEEKGHLEKLVHYELAEHCVTLPNGRLAREILGCDVSIVLDTIDRVAAENPQSP